jgi:hypothetical protein
MTVLKVLSPASNWMQESVTILEHACFQTS